MWPIKFETYVKNIFLSKFKYTNYGSSVQKNPDLRNIRVIDTVHELRNLKCHVDI